MDAPTTPTEPRSHHVWLARAARSIVTCAAVIATASSVDAMPSYAVHMEGAAARMAGDRKSDQFGWGGGGLIAPELTLGTHVGLELPIGGLVLGEGPVDEPGFADTQEGYSLFALPGVRVRPFGRNGHRDVLDPGGLWIAGGTGVAQTGEHTRAAVDARAGFDLFAGHALRVGPFGGYLQIIETSSELRPEDARVVLFGVHGAFEPPAAPAELEDDDRDDDGIRNADDGCPDDPEDFDAYEDDDGCPELDNDDDGILDVQDGCPNDPEDRDGFQDRDGCPDPDNDDDGILDKPDQCPNEPENIDGFEDEDGCPDEDNDQDGIVDLTDQCPNDPETVNGYADEDGCPDQDKVRVVGSEILLDDRVHFRTNMAAVQTRSWPLLHNVAELLQANPQYTSVRVQGHADDTGESEYNDRLSVRRSEAVRRILVHYGVDEARLVVEGFGESRPRVEDTSVSARRKNRRVEFLILERKDVRPEGPKSAADLLKAAEEEGR